MAQLLGNVAVGSIVKLNENGSPVDYLVVHQGKPSSLYDDSCNGTWLLRKDIYAVQQWNSSNNSTFTSATINTTYLPSLLALYDTDIQPVIKTVKIPYCVGGGSPTVNSGASGFSCQLFLLSGCEVGFDTVLILAVDGAKLSYFESDRGSSANNKRIAKLNGSAVDWWLRSPITYDTSNVLRVNSAGDYNDNGSSTEGYGIRPAMILPTDLLVLDDGSVSAIGTPTLTAPTTVVQNQPISLSWSSVSGATSYQLQRNTGSSWETIYTGPNTSYEDTAGNWSSVQYQVCALVDTDYGAYSDPQTVTILPPSAVPTINSISTVNLTESFTITWNSAANADSYVLQRNIGSGWEEVYSGANLQYQDQALYSNMSYRVASVITDLYQSAWSPEYTVDINGQMIEMNVKNADGSYEAIYPKTLIGNIAGIEDQYYTKEESLQSNVATLIGLTNQAVPNDMFNILAHAGDLHVWKRTIDGNTDYPVSVNRNSYQEGDNAKPAGYTLGEIQNGQFALIGSNVGLSYQYGDVNVSDGGSLSIKSPVTLTIRPATNVDQLNVMRGKFVRASGSTALGDFPKNQVFYIPEDAVFEVYDTGSGYNGSRVNKRQVVTGYPAIPANITIEYLGQLGNKAQVEVGSYVGTGKYGKNNPNTLTFEFEPKIIIIGNDRGGVYINFYFWGAVGMNGANNFAAENIVSTSNFTISWYHPSDVSGQLNASGITYNYIAIG